MSRLADVVGGIGTQPRGAWQQELELRQRDVQELTGFELNRVLHD
jgi:hypothetical protein